MANSVDPDEIAHNESSFLDLHCLQKYLFWSARLKGLLRQPLCEVRENLRKIRIEANDSTETIEYINMTPSSTCSKYSRPLLPP